MNAVAPLNHYLTEVPQKNFFTLNCKAWTLSVLEKISWVAAIAIVAVILTISYTGVALTGTTSLLVAGLALSTIPIISGITKFSDWANQFFNRAEVEGRVALGLKEMKETSPWKTPEIEQFFREQGLEIAAIPIAALQQINEKEPLCALLPAIARFQYLKQTAARLEERAKEEFRKAEESRGDPAKAQIRFEGRRLGREHMQRAMGMALDAAVMLRIIQQPFNPLLDIRQSDNTIPSVGECRPKGFWDDAYDHRYEPNDNYLIFKKDLRRPLPLTETEIQADLNPRTLYQKIFNPRPE